MNKLLRMRLLCGMLTLFILAGGVSVAHAEHAWGKYHWARTTTEFHLPVGNNTTEAWTTILGLVLSDWANQVGKDVSITGGFVESPYPAKTVIPEEISGTAGKACSAVLGTTQVCNGKYGRNGWLGLASIWASGSHITKATAKHNDSYFSRAPYNNQFEKQHVMCQEVAHTFGLGHQSEDFDTSFNTCMDYSTSTADDIRSISPNNHDYGQLEEIYTHTESSSTVKPIASALATQADANPSDDDNQRQWGRLLSQSKNGRSSTYEQTLENGIKIVRHVYWTEETAAKCPACDHRFHDKE